MSRLYLAVTCKSMDVVRLCYQYSALRKWRLKGRPLNHPPPFIGDAYLTEVSDGWLREKISTLGLDKAKCVQILVKLRSKGFSSGVLLRENIKIAM